MQFINKQSIRQKLISFAMITSTVVLLLASMAFVAVDLYRLTKSLKEKQKSQAEILAFNCTAALSFNDNLTANRILESLKYQHDVVAAIIYDLDNNIFAQYQRDKTITDVSSPGKLEEKYYFDGGNSHLYKKINLDDELIGYIYIKSDLSPIIETLKLYASVGLVVLLISGLFAYLLSRRLQKIISRPITKLAEVAKTISGERNFQVRAEKYSDDEIGDLVDTFNSMLEQILLQELNRDSIEKALRESEVNFRSFFNNSSTGNMEMDLDGRFIRANVRFLRMLGYDEKDLLSLNNNDVTHEDDKERANEILEKLKSGVIDSFRTEKRYIRKDNSVFWGDLSLTAVRKSKGKKDKIIGVVVNISERKKMENTLIEHQKLLKILIDTIPEIIFVKDIDHKFLVVNKAFAEMYDTQNQDELIGKSDFDFYPEDKAELFHKAEDVIMQGNPQINKLDLVIEEDGSRKWLENTKLPLLDSEDNIKGLVGITRDITENKLKEHELRNYQEHLEELVINRTSEVEEKARELEKANIRLKELDRLKSTFLASMSHELRTPLNSIIGFTGIILMGMSGDLNDEQKKQLNMVKSNANHLLSLINDILDISKIEAGRAEVHPEKFELNDLIDEIVASSTPLTNEKGLDFIKEVPENIEIFSDIRRLKQIIINLTSNAIKFTEEGSIFIKAWKYNDENMNFCVRDTGIGIKEEDMEKLFIPFQQIDVTLTKKYEGTGLGLSLTKRMVELLGGTISVKSEYGKGTEFTVGIPLEYSEDKKHEADFSY